MKKVLIIQNKRIGDVLHSSIIADNIKQVFPDASVHFLTYDYAAGVITNHKNIDNVIKVSEKPLKNIFNLLSLALMIRRSNYDIIFDPYAKFQSRVICLIATSKYKIGFSKKRNSIAYTHNVPFLKQKTKLCGKSIEDRVNLVSTVFNVTPPKFNPKIYLTKVEQHYEPLDAYSDKPIVVFGILGSNQKKSMPSNYIIELINTITAKFDIYVVFNYAPYQIEEAKAIYNKCLNKQQILFDIYETTIRGFVRLMNAAQLLIANEGGAVHIAKALNKPTFTIYSPYILRDSWASFEDGIRHTSVHLLDYMPNLFETDKETRKKIEEAPKEFYLKFNPTLFKDKLNAFLKPHIS